MMSPDEYKNGHIKDDSVMKGLSVDTKIYLLDGSIENVRAKVEGIERQLGNAVKWIVGALLVAGISALVVIGSYKERVDATSKSVERLEIRSIEMAEKISALTAAIEAQRDR